MNIAVVCPNDQSAFLFCGGLLRELKSRPGVETVFVISDVFGEGAAGAFARTVESWGVTHIPIRMERFLSPMEDIRYLLRLRALLRRYRVGIAINIATKPNIYGPVAARLAGVERVLCSVWGRGRIFGAAGSVKDRLLRAGLLQMYRLAFRLSDRVWFTNKNDLDFFLAAGGLESKKAILTKFYVDIEEFRPAPLSGDKAASLRASLGLGARDKVVIMVARMLWAKGVREFVDASQLLKERLPGARFLLVGPKEKDSVDTVPQSYLDETRKLRNFRWLGFRADMKDLYALSDVAVLPSYYNEGGYPKALTEPMAMGKPVIAADSAGCRATVEHGRNGYLIPPRDAGALASAIEALMTDDARRNAFGACSRRKAEAEFDEVAIIKQMLDEFLADGRAQRA